MTVKADIPKLERIAGIILNERGYLVVSIAPGEYQVGQIIHQLWNVKIDQPLRVIAITNKQDWLDQHELVLQKSTSFYKEETRVPWNLEESTCYRVITD